MATVTRPKRPPIVNLPNVLTASRFVLARELIITSLRGFLESEGIRFGADMLGKIKMWLQCAALVAVFVTLYDYTAGDWRTVVCPWFIWVMVAATALSGAQYLWKAT